MQLDGQYGDFLALVRLGIGNSIINSQLKADWTELMTLAEQQGLTGVVLDGIERLPETTRPPKVQLLQWIGQVMQGYEQRYEVYCWARASLEKFYKSHGFKMMVLKGYACAMNWPKPQHRPSGDIDIWLFGRQKEADATLKDEKGITVDKNKQHHTVFYWGDFMVENHFDFLDVRHHKSNEGLERILKEMGQDDSHYVELNGEKIYIPSPNMHALFLLKHAMSHFAAEGITIRHLIDWGFYAKAHTNEIDWDWIEGVLKQYGMMPAFDIFNAICVENLGFDVGIFPHIQFNPFLKDKVLDEIINPAFFEEFTQEHHW